MSDQAEPVTHANREGNEGRPPEVERDASAPVQQADAIPQHVDLVGVLSDEFGIPRAQARREMLMGTIGIDGEPYRDPRQGLNTHDFVVPHTEIVGKTVEVVGGETNRTYRFQIQ